MTNKIYSNAKHYSKLGIEGLYYGCQPIRANYTYKKATLKGNDYLKLFGALYIIAEHNEDLLNEYYFASVHDVLSSASISDDELYLNGFEGYELNDRYTIKTLFLSDNQVIMVSVHDRRYDRFIDFVA